MLRPPEYELVREQAVKETIQTTFCQDLKTIEQLLHNGESLRCIRLHSEPKSDARKMLEEELTKHGWQLKKDVTVASTTAEYKTWQLVPA